MKRALIPLLLLLALSPAAAQPDPGALDFHCYCVGAVQTPQRIARANAALLLRARDGIPAGAVPPARLAALQRFGLVRRIGRRVQTTFPILMPDATARLRARAAELGMALALRLAPDVAALGGTLARRGQTQSDYALVFGYALDTRLWAHLKRDLPQTRPDARHPVWRGVFWAASPQRPDAADTSETGNGAVRLVLVGAAPVSDRLKRFAASRDARRLLARPDEMMPVVVEAPADPIFRIADAMAAAVVQALTGPQGTALLAAVPGVTRQQALVIAAHELIWSIADTLVSSGQMIRPAVLDGENLPLAPLLFIRRTP